MPSLLSETPSQYDPYLLAAAGSTRHDRFLRSKCCVVAFLAALGILLLGAVLAIVFGVRRIESNTSVDDPSNEITLDASSVTGTSLSSTVTHENPRPLPPVLEEDLQPDRDTQNGKANIFYGINYSPFGLGDSRMCPPWNNSGGMCLPEGQVKRDMRLLSGITRRVKVRELDFLLRTRLPLTKANMVLISLHYSFILCTVTKQSLLF
jgi:hypothetical protein